VHIWSTAELFQIGGREYVFANQYIITKLKRNSSRATKENHPEDAAQNNSEAASPKEISETACPKAADGP